MTYSHTILRNMRSGNVKWTLRVALDRESYHAGDILQANVFMCVMEPVHCNVITGFIRGEEKITWSEKAAHRAVGEEVYSQQNEFLNDKMIVAKPRMYGPGEYVVPVVYQLHSTPLPASFQLKCHPEGVMNGVHAQLGYVFLVCLNADQGVLLEAQQEIVIQEAVVPTRTSALGLDVAVPTQIVQLAAPSDESLSVTLDKAAYRSRETLRVRCRLPNAQSGGRELFPVILRLFEDVSVAVAPAKQGKCCRLLCERSYQVVAADAPAFELALELASGRTVAISSSGASAPASSTAGTASPSRAPHRAATTSSRPSWQSSFCSSGTSGFDGEWRNDKVSANRSGVVARRCALPPFVPPAYALLCVRAGELFRLARLAAGPLSENKRQHVRRNTPKHQVLQLQK